MPVVSFAQLQWGSSDLIGRFKEYTLYSSGKIEALRYSIKPGYKNLSVSFDTLGHPVMIGKCRHGINYGKWLNASGEIFYYKNGQCENATLPGCGTGLAANKKRFLDLYWELIN